MDRLPPPWRCPPSRPFRRPARPRFPTRQPQPSWAPPGADAANVALPAHAREPLEHLCRYLLRPPLAMERLTETSGGQLLYELPHSRRDGSTHLLLDPLELIEQLSVLIPSPRFPLRRFHGLFAPHAAWRAQIIASLREDVDQEVGGGRRGGRVFLLTRPHRRRLVGKNHARTPLGAVNK